MLRRAASMFGVFRREIADPLLHPQVSAVRAHTRNLIRLANVAESGGLAHAASDSREWQAMTEVEARLGSSICAAVLDKLSLQIIVGQIIDPILRDAVVVSDAADAAVRRAVGQGARARPGGRGNAA